MTKACLQVVSCDVAFWIACDRWPSGLRRHSLLRSTSVRLLIESWLLSRDTSVFGYWMALLCVHRLNHDHLVETRAMQSCVLHSPLREKQTCWKNFPHRRRCFVYLYTVIYPCVSTGWVFVRRSAKLGTWNTPERSREISTAEDFVLQSCCDKGDQALYGIIFRLFHFVRRLHRMRCFVRV